MQSSPQPLLHFPLYYYLRKFSYRRGPLGNSNVRILASFVYRGRDNSVSILFRQRDFLRNRDVLLIEDELELGLSDDFCFDRVFRIRERLLDLLLALSL
jgi:hypothetical protein